MVDVRRKLRGAGWVPPRLFTVPLVLCVTLSALIGAAAGAAYAASVSDNFNRVNGALGSNWSTVAGTTAPAIANNVLQAGTAGRVNSAFWSGSSFGSDQFSQAIMPSSSGTQFGPGVAVRLAGSRGYFLWYGNSANTVSLWRMDSATSWTQLRASSALTISASDVWKVQVVGSTLSGYQNGNLVVQVTDGTYASGSPGVWLYYSANRIDNWSGGDVTTGTASYTVGGSVSGLSGTLVLQDNGGDDRTVTADGGFTFATPVAAGSAYSVTVKSKPAGQSCAVANGSGTVSGNVTNVTVICAGSTASASDDFNRADGVLGNSWTAFDEGGLGISSQTVIGTSSSGVSGNIRSGEGYIPDQYSQIEVTASQLSGTQWIGASVRSQSGGKDAYVGVYAWNSGSPGLVLYRRSAGVLSQIAPVYDSGPLAAGTKLKLMAVGSTIAFLQDGVERMAVYDDGLSGGSPGIMISGSARADNWYGGSAGFELHFLGTDANGVESYDAISATNGYGPEVVRILRPTNPVGTPHNFLYALPVEPGLGTTYGDGLDALRALNAQNKYNVTIIEPTFAGNPWYADNPLDPNLRHETFMTAELQPWVTAHLATTSAEQHWLIGLSKSGLGAEDLLFKHPDLFTQAATWDFPADMSSYSLYGAGESYGTEDNFQTNYRLTPAFVDARKSPFLAHSRLWIGGYQTFQTDVSDFDALLTSDGIPHLAETPPQPMAHRWDSGWLPIALAALQKNGAAL